MIDEPEGEYCLGEGLLRTYLVNSPYPTYLFSARGEATSTAHHANEDHRTSAAGPFQLHSSRWYNAEAERCSGGRGLWSCLPPDSRAHLRRRVQAFWGKERARADDKRGDDKGSRSTFELLMMVMVLTPGGGRIAELRKIAWTACLMRTAQDGEGNEDFERNYLLTLTAMMSPEDMLIPVDKPLNARRTSSLDSRSGSSTAGQSVNSADEVPFLRDAPVDQAEAGSPIVSIGREPGKRNRRRHSEHAWSSVGNRSQPDGHVEDRPSKPIPTSSAQSLEALELRRKDEKKVVAQTLGHARSSAGSSPLGSRRSSASPLSGSMEDISAQRPLSLSPDHLSSPRMSQYFPLDGAGDVDRTGPSSRRPRQITPEEAMDVISVAPVGIVLATDEGKVVFANPHWYGLCGMDRFRPIDEWMENIEDGHMKEFRLKVTSVILQKQLGRFEFQWKNGNWTEMFMVPQLDQDESEIVSIVAVLTDITSRKRLELLDSENVRERERVLRQAYLDAEVRELELAAAAKLKRQLDKSTRELAKLANLSTVGLCSLNERGVIIWTNQAYHDIHALPRGRENEWESCIVPADRERVQREWAKADAARVPFVSRHRLINGKTISVVSMPHQPPGEPITWIASIADITEQTESAAALKALTDEKVQALARQAIEAEERRVRAETQREQQALLVDVVSHELRNGISPILHPANLIRASLMDGSLPIATDAWHEQLREDLEACDAILDSARAMERVANDVLSLAQVQLGQLSVSSVPFSIEQRLRAVARIYQADCRSKDVELFMDFGNLSTALGPGTTLMTDPQRLHQLIVNLLSNAIKFVVLGGKERKVTLTATISANPPSEDGPVEPPSIASGLLPADSLAYLYISVNDTGPGMAPEHLTKLFQKWSQATPDVHVTSDGSGLGLFIAKALAGLLRGRVDVTSIEGHGSTFRFYVTVGIPRPPTEVTSSTASAPPQISQGQGTRLRLLVVDDNAVNRKILVRQLTQLNHEVVQAQNGEVALSAVSAARDEGRAFDGCLMDVNMPVLDGLSATARLRREEAARKETKPLLVIGCTGNARQAQLDAALDAGMNAVLTKPYRLADIVDLLRRVS